MNLASVSAERAQSENEGRHRSGALGHRRLAATLSALTATVCLLWCPCAEGQTQPAEPARTPARALRSLLVHGLAEDDAPGASWGVGEVTPRGGTLEIVFLRRHDEGPLSTLVRRSGTSLGSYTIESTWHGRPPEPHGLHDVVSWLHRWIETHPAAIAAVFEQVSRSATKERGEGVRRRSSRPGRLQDAAVELAAVVALASGVLVVLRRRKLDRALLIAGTGLAVVAFIPRWWFATHGVYHENHHGYRYLESLLTGEVSAFAEIVFAYPTVVGPLARLLGGTDEVVFALNAALGAWSAVALAALIRRWSRSDWCGMLAGVIWALAPYPIRLGPTELFANFSTATLLTAAVALCHALDHVDLRGVWRSTPELFLAASLTSLAAMSRILTLAHPAAVFGLAFACGAIRSTKQWRSAAGIAVVVALWILPLGREILAESESSSVSLGVHILLRDLTHGDLMLLDPSSVPVTILVLAGIGAVVVVARRSWRLAGEGVIGLSSCALVVAVGALPYGFFVSRSRLELAGTALAMGLAGIGAGRPGNTTAVGKRRAVLRVVGAALALSTIASWPLLSRPVLGTLEYRHIIDEVLPVMREAQQPVIFLRPDTGRLVEQIEASWWQRQVAGITVESFDHDHLTHGHEHEAETGTVFMLIGLECFWFTDAPEFDPGSELPRPGDGLGFAADPALGGQRMHPACAEVLRNGGWRAAGEPLVLDRRASAGAWAPLLTDHNRVQLYRKDER